MNKFLLILFLVPFVSIGQEEAESKPENEKKKGRFKWEIGVNGGVTLTKATFATDTKVENRVGQMYGLTVVYHPSKFIAIKTDFDIENKGWVLKDYELNLPSTSGVIKSTQDVIQKLEYFDIPAFFHFGFGKKIRFDVNFGPYIAFLLKSNAIYIDTEGREVVVTEAAFTNYKKIDLGLTYGGGLEYILNERYSFAFDILYENGMKNIADGGVKNKSIDFDFGFNMNLAR